MCEGQEAVEAGVTRRREGVPVPLQPEGLQPLTHGPLRHTHLLHNWHTHFWARPWLQHRTCGPVGGETDDKIREILACNLSHCRTMPKIKNEWTMTKCSRGLGMLSAAFTAPVSSCAAQGPGVADQFIQHVEDLAEGGSLCPLSLPAIQHELVQHHRTVHGSRQSIALFYRFNHLNRGLTFFFIF